ncbi:hypothetical protein [Psychrosphaera algicola]|uniref:Uncharacterized protein n=1 Tax=Psychrosphaera algicola TaxID=3023714 RepID=A0ABT5FFT6_9GAMM|nr:hypothetical protein [Psychrosphaera sp. G1-22]MDC2890378.1 hypothetical protein [Psychrosphaera sp. G1-22]
MTTNVPSALQQDFICYLIEIDKIALAEAVMDDAVAELSTLDLLCLQNLSVAFKHAHNHLRDKRICDSMALVTLSGWGRGSETTILV